MSRRNHPRLWIGLAAGLALGSLAQGAMAQSYGGSSGNGGMGRSGNGSRAAQADGADGAGDQAQVRRERTRIRPYIEAAQVAQADLSGGGELLTWSMLAAGVDASIRGANSEGSASVRYERRFGWGKAASGDAISGLARGQVAIVPRALAVEAGALATRTTVDGSSAAVPGSFIGRDSTQLYSLYAGPTVNTRAGALAVNGGYRIGYTKVGTSERLRTNGVTAGGDAFDKSTIHDARLHAGVRPGEVLPVGLGLGTGYRREDVSNLDQRIKDFHARADVTVPVSGALALVGGVGYENVKVSSRDALRDANGLPVIGGNGRYVTDTSTPRRIAYEASGLIWDAGVTWKPSPRTALEAHVGRRYGSTTYYGSFGWRVSPRSALNVSVYDNVSGFGGQLNQALVALPNDFEALRNPATGELSGCVNPTGSSTTAPTGATCLTGALGSLRSAVFRARGVQGSYAVTLGRLGFGLAGGYDHRRFLAAPGTILASANGTVDRNTWLSAWLTGRLDQSTSFGTTVYADWFRSGLLTGGDGTALGANATLSHDFGNRISGTAAIGLQGLQRQQLEDFWQASALLGVRYSFF